MLLLTEMGDFLTAVYGVACISLRDGVWFVCLPVSGMKSAVCSAFLRKACAPKSTMTTAVNIFTFTRNPVPGAKYPTPFPLQHAEQDVAMFLLARGEYAFIGYGWQGCQCLPTDKYDGCLPQNMTYEFPELLERDYGEPLKGQQCTETVPGQSGIFTREWSGAQVRMDCNTWTPTITMKPPPPPDAPTLTQP